MVAVLAGLLCLLLISGCIGGLSAEDVIEKAQEKYNSIEDFEATVVSVTPRHDAPNEILTVEMVWKFKRPNKVYFEYKKPVEVEGNVQVSNGHSYLIYDAKENKARRTQIDSTQRINLDIDPRPIMEAIEVANIDIVGTEKLDGNEVYRIAVTPKDARDEGRMELWIEKETWMVLKMEVYGQEKLIMSMRYENAKFNQGLPDSEFEFEIPEGAEVIDEEGLPGVVRSPELVGPQTRAISKEGYESPWIELSNVTNLEEAQELVNFKIRVPAYLPEEYYVPTPRDDGTKVRLRRIKGHKHEDYVIISYWNPNTQEYLKLSERISGNPPPFYNYPGEMVYINGDEGKLFSKDGIQYGLMWYSGEQKLSLVLEPATAENKEELIKIAESIQ